VVLHSSLKKDAFWSAGAAIVLTGSRFALAAVLARRLSQEAFGQYAYAQWLVDISFLLFAFGATGAVSRYAAEYRHDTALLSRFLRTWRRYALLLPLGAGLVSVFGSYVSQLALPPSGIVCLAVWTVSSGLWAMQTAALTGLQRFDLVFRANVVAAMTMIIGALFLPLDSTDPSRALLLMACASFMGAAIGYNAVSKAVNSSKICLKKNESRHIVRYAINIWLTAILWNIVWSRGEIPIVRAYLGDGDLAKYSVALTLMGGAIAGVMLGVGGLAPQVTRFWGEGCRNKAIDLCRKVMDIQLLTCSTASHVLVWMGPELLYFSFGENYTDSANVLYILALILPTMALSLHNHLLQIATDSQFNRNCSIVGLIILMILAIVSVPHFGILGAAVSRVTAILIMSSLTFFVFFKKFGSCWIELKKILTVEFILLLSVSFVFINDECDLIYRIFLFLISIALNSFIMRKSFLKIYERFIKISK